MSARYVYQLLTFVIPEDQRIERVANSVSTDYEILTSVHTHLLPSTGTFAGFVAGTPLLCDQAFKALFSYGLDQIRKTRR